MIKKVINGEVHEACKFFDRCPIASVLCYKKNSDEVCAESLIEYSKALRAHTDEMLKQLLDLEIEGKRNGWEKKDSK